MKALAALLLFAQTGATDFKTNYAAGESLLRQGKLPAAIPYLEKAWRADPTHYANAWDLALAYLRTGKIDEARRQVLAMMPRFPTSELPNLLGDIEEKAGNRTEAARRYQEAAQMEPNEKNVSDWAAFLLRQKEVDASVRIYRRGVELHPKSSALRVGLGVALNARGLYDEAVKALCEAVDLDPADPRPMMFLGQMYDVSPGMAEEVTRRLARFAQAYPKSAQAQLYYGLSLVKGGGEPPVAEKYLKAALRLNPRLPEAHLQLGMLYEQQNKDAAAIQAFSAAVTLDPAIESAHFRLARLYQRAGQPEAARREREIYERLHKQRLSQ